MPEDHILEELRRAREAHARKFNFDLDAIFRDLKEQERRSGRTFVRFPARRAVHAGRDAVAGRKTRTKEDRVPTVSRFFGVVITINYSDHPPPHFHARYAEHKAVLEIASLVVLEGSLPPRVLGLVVEWAKLHQVELLADWELAAAQKPLQPIAPLE